MRVAIRAGLVATACLGLVLAGCSDDAPAPSSPAGAAEQPNANPPPDDNYGAPKVPQPIDTNPLNANPCAAITAEQVASLGEPLQNAEPQATGGCTWRLGTAEEARGQIRGTLFPSDSGLASVYKKREQGKLPHFQPVTIAGYPAVINAKEESVCGLAAGLRDDQYYVVSAQSRMDSPMRGNECQTAQKATEFAINNLKGAS